ncbi:sensor domain-containing diguanylate cyclase [Pseudodesulfovibrio sediminis]|uniref:diguanylate cyclase n=1 Tax=Pseudodesulfovibrio sediminis TaxID=2810563 RepID=A0ABN6ESR9_9BACT|nr:sensor domain-containing diguanylate cyclase [Pseudodesulfovibrio sediminis]BCS89397.1 GGDEF domain-containing protein [Pseudodesulfovibrio sediminis]
MSVKIKLLLALTLILLSSFVVTSLINYTVTRDAVREELLNSSLPLTGKNIYSEIQTAMMRPIMVSSSMANDTFLKDWVLNGEKDEEEITRYLSRLKEKYNFITAFFVSATTDKYYYQDGILKEIGPRDPHDIWYYAFVRSKKEYNLDVDSNEAEGGTLTIFINFRVEDKNGRLLGVAGVGVNLSTALKLLAKARKEYHREIYLVDQDGLVQVHQDIRRIEKYYITKAGGIRDVAQAILSKHGEQVSTEYDWEQDHILLSARYIPELQWHLIVEQNEEDALTSARENMIRTLIVGGIASFLIIILCVVTINHFQSRLEKLVLTDPLTGAANRRALDSRFEQSAYKSDRYDAMFSAIIIDLNNFKKINDSYGHVMGDKVLKHVAGTMTSTVRPTDLLARWGGDEFIILMDGNTDDARVLATRIRAATSQTPFSFPVSFSYGIAQYEEGDDIDSLTQRADQMLYEAKARIPKTEGM